MAELRARLERRAEDSAATIDKRLDNAKREIERWRQYDYVVVNDDLQRAYAQVVGDPRRRAGPLRARRRGRRGFRRRSCWRGRGARAAKRSKIMFAQRLSRIS